MAPPDPDEGTPEWHARQPTDDEAMEGTARWLIVTTGLAALALTLVLHGQFFG